MKTATEISESLRKNTTLTYLSWDNNGVNIGGYQAFRSCLTTSNKTLFEVPHPRQDVEKAISSSKDQTKFRERITELFNEVNAALKSNKEGHKSGDSLRTNIFSRQKEEYKEPPEAPPVSAIPTHGSRISTLRQKQDPRILSDSSGTLREKEREKKEKKKREKKEKKGSKRKGKEKNVEKENESDSEKGPEGESERDRSGDDANPDEDDNSAEKPREEEEQQPKRMVAPPPLAVPPAMVAHSDGINTYYAPKSTTPPVFYGSMNGKTQSIRPAAAPPVFSPPPGGRGRGSAMGTHPPSLALSH